MTSHIHVPKMSATATATATAAAAAPPPPMSTLARTPPVSIPMRATTSRPSSSSSTMSTVSAADSARSFRAACYVPIVAGAGGPSRCAFPCWPDRRSLDAAPEEYTSAYISDADLFLDDDEPVASPLMAPRPEEDESFPFQVPEEEILDEVVVCPRVRARVRPRPPMGYMVAHVPTDPSSILRSTAARPRRPSADATQRRRRSSRRTPGGSTRKALAPTAD